MTYDPAEHDPTSRCVMEEVSKALTAYEAEQKRKAEDPYKLGFEIVNRGDGTIPKTEDDEWLAWAAAKVAEEDNFAQPHGKRPKKPIRLQPSMKTLTSRRKKNKLARASRRRNRK